MKGLREKCLFFSFQFSHPLFYWFLLVNFLDKLYVVVGNSLFASWMQENFSLWCEMSLSVWLGVVGYSHSELTRFPSIIRLIILMTSHFSWLVNFKFGHISDRVNAPHPKNTSNHCCSHCSQKWLPEQSHKRSNQKLVIFLKSFVEIGHFTQLKVVRYSRRQLGKLLNLFFHSMGFWKMVSDFLS